MDFLIEFPTMDRQDLRDLKKAIDKGISRLFPGIR